MACRIGISTNPARRITDWKAEDGHTRSRIIASGLSYREAQDLEKGEAKRRRCYRGGGGNLGGKRHQAVRCVYQVFRGDLKS